MSTPLLILTDALMARHDTGPGHPERAERLICLLQSLERNPPPGARVISPRTAEWSELARFHTADYLARVEALAGVHGQLDPDTQLSPDSVDAARLAAGACLDGLDALFAGEAERAFALVRPPGHHAERHLGMGFCLFNNIAVAAEAARHTGLAKRVLVVDWDVHHGNGTARGFEDRADVFVFNVHQAPLYPGTGRADERGVDAGLGMTRNVPLAAGANDSTYMRALERELVPAAEDFQPDLVLVSTGFDAHQRDPLGGMRVTDQGFADMAGLVRELADKHAGGRLLAALEGGYDLDGLEGAVRAVIDAWT